MMKGYPGNLPGAMCERVSSPLFLCHAFFMNFVLFASPLLIRQETVEQLLTNIFDKEKNESAIVSVIQILLTLFETRRPA